MQADGDKSTDKIVDFTNSLCTPFAVCEGKNSMLFLAHGKRQIAMGILLIKFALNLCKKNVDEILFSNFFVIIV